MLSEAVFRKSLQGAQTIASRERRLAPRLRSLLILVDGKRPFSELARLGAALGEPQALLGQLVDAGLVEVVEAAEPAAPPEAAAAPHDAPAADTRTGSVADPEPVAPERPADEAMDSRVAEILLGGALAQTAAEVPTEAPVPATPLADRADPLARPPSPAPSLRRAAKAPAAAVPAKPTATDSHWLDSINETLATRPAAPRRKRKKASRGDVRVEPVWLPASADTAAPRAAEPDPRLDALAELLADTVMPPEDPGGTSAMEPAPVAAAAARPARPKRLWRSHQNVPITREALVAVMALPVSAPAPLSATPDRPLWPMTPEELDSARDYALRELQTLLGNDADILGQSIAIAVTAEEMIYAVKRTQVFLRSLRGEAVAVHFAAMVRANTALP